MYSQTCQNIAKQEHILCLSISVKEKKNSEFQASTSKFKGKHLHKHDIFIDGRCVKPSNQPLPCHFPEWHHTCSKVSSRWSLARTSWAACNCSWYHSLALRSEARSLRAVRASVSASILAWMLVWTSTYSSA